VIVGAEETQHALLSASSNGESAAAVTVVDAPNAGLLGRRMLQVQGVEGTDRLGTLGLSSLDAEALRLMDEVIKDPRAHDGLRSFETVDGTFELYLEVRRPIQELVVVGAGHVAQPMAHMGALLGYRVTVLDDRPDFATRERFPEADRLVQADFSDPFAEVVLHERSHLLLVTRGHKYDYECLIRALRADPAPAYIGMIGSRRRVRATYVQLIAEGIDRTLIDRIHAPVGLDIGAETPEEIAVSVAAELVMLNRGGSGVPLKDVERVSERFFQNSRQDEDK
jgi:xanthine dehydrogenase accessory factor